MWLDSHLEPGLGPLGVTPGHELSSKANELSFSADELSFCVLNGGRRSIMSARSRRRE
jgi:hypothetical protein